MGRERSQREGDGTNNKAIGEIKQVHREVRGVRGEVCKDGMGDEKRREGKIVVVIVSKERKKENRYTLVTISIYETI